MKKQFSFLFLILVCLCFCVNAFAHSGNTDSSGGHYDRSTGQYHYHHGYPAHQHTGGTCPYNFVDKTGSLGGTTKQVDYLKSQIDDLEFETNALKKENDELKAKNSENLKTITELKSTISDKNYCIFGLGSLSALVSFFYLSARSEKKAAEQKLKAFVSSRDSDVAKIKTQYAEKEKVYISNIEALTNRKVSSSSLYVKISPNSSVYHRVNCNSASKYSRTVPIYEVPITFSPCKICCPPELEQATNHPHTCHSTNYLR